LTALIIDGKTIAKNLRQEVKYDVAKFKNRYGRVPRLDVFLIGDNPASKVYVANKEKAVIESDMQGFVHRLPDDISQEELLRLLNKTQTDSFVDGILVQLPLPKHINVDLIMNAIDYRHDVDGFHPINVGLLASGRPFLVPCTPMGCMHLIESTGFNLSGAKAVVVGRSNIVGKPMAQLLLSANATVTIAHSKTKDLFLVCKEADVLIAAVGIPNFIKGFWIKDGAIVIDVGINRVNDKLIGDVEFETVKEVAGFITPVPGGVGPMTIAYLLKNTLKAASLKVV
jgi:methylenetetrahydrofolate dehydrogenase (NADP+)/methenyltetrahydrofolate cyclohydrolase